MWARWFNLSLAAWLLVAPFVLGYGEPIARFNDAAVGVGLAVAVLASASFPALRLAQAALGGWLFLAPVLLRYGDHALPTANDIVVEGLVICAALLPEARLPLPRLRRAPRV